MANIPKPTAPVAGNFLMAREWWNYFNRLDASFNVAGLAEQLAAIQKELAELSKPGQLPVQSVNRKHGAVILDAGDVGADPVGSAATAVAAHVADTDPHPQYTTAAEVDAAIAATAGTVTSVALSVPTGLVVAGSPITASGTFTVSYAADYQGYTAAEATKLAGVATGATVGAAWGSCSYLTPIESPGLPGLLGVGFTPQWYDLGSRRGYGLALRGWIKARLRSSDRLCLLATCHQRRGLDLQSLARRKA